MGVITYESEVTSPIPPARLFKAFVLDADNLIPKISPHTIKSTEIIEGNGGAGTIKKVTFHEGEYIYTNFSPNTFNNAKKSIGWKISIHILAFMECNLFNGSGASISFNNFSALNSVWWNPGDEFVR